MKFQLVKGSTDVRLYLFIRDSSAAIPEGLTGLAYNTANLVCYYVRPGAGAVQLPLVEFATPAVTDPHLDGGFIEIDSVNLPGIYRLDLSDAILASGVDSVVLMLHGAANMEPVPIEIQLTSVNMNDSVRAGLSSLPAAVPASDGGLPTVNASNRVVGLQENVTVGANNDKTGYSVDNINDKVDYSLSASAITAIINAISSRVIEGTITDVQVMRALAAYILSNKTVASGVHSYRDTANSKNRFVATVDGSGNRTVSSRDLT